MAQVEKIEAKKKGTAVARNLLKVAAYCRVSTDLEDQATSYDSQQKFYRSYIEGHEGWQFAGIYADYAITGTMVEKRVGFQKMIDDAKNGVMDLIICKSISRFARNTVDTLQYVRMLKNLGIEVYFEEENIRTMTMDGELLLTVLSSVAQQEVENISEHVKAANRHRMAEGIPVGFTECLGYRYDRVQQKLVVIESEAEIVRFIFEKYLEGCGPTQIKRELENRGYRTKKGNTVWHQGTIHSILRNEKYKGDLLMGKYTTIDPINKKIVINRGESEQYLVRSAHEAIISPEIFDKAQALMNKHAADFNLDSYGTRTRYSNAHPFSNKIRCGFCGAPVTRRSVHGNSAKYRKVIWTCRTYYQGRTGKCADSRGVPEQLIEKAFVECFNHLITNRDEVLDKLLDNVQQALELKGAQKLLHDNRERQKVLINKNSALIDLLMDNKIVQEEYDIKHTENLKKLDYLKQEEESLSTITGIKEESLNRIVSFREALEDKKLMTEFQPTIFDLVIDRILIGGETEEGKKDPYAIMFVFKSGVAAEIDGEPLKEDKRRKQQLSSNGEVLVGLLSSDDEGEGLLGISAGREGIHTPGDGTDRRCLQKCRYIFHRSEGR